MFNLWAQTPSESCFDMHSALTTASGQLVGLVLTFPFIYKRVSQLAGTGGKATPYPLERQSKLQVIHTGKQNLHTGGNYTNACKPFCHNRSQRFPQPMRKSSSAQSAKSRSAWITFAKDRKCMKTQRICGKSSSA
jgi:hypothetical protein